MLTLKEIYRLDRKRTRGIWRVTKDRPEFTSYEVCFEHEDYNYMPFVITKIPKGTGNVNDADYIAATPSIVAKLREMEKVIMDLHEVCKMNHLQNALCYGKEYTTTVLFSKTEAAMTSSQAIANEIMECMEEKDAV